MKILNLTIHNFKGIKDLSIHTSGGNLDIFGDNATGKTTVFDAFLWLLFDKDSQNKKMDDQIKYRDTLGNINDHGTDHEVEGIFDIAGRQVTLKKVFSETWTKKRGSATSTFTGHSTNYFIDGVPAKKKEYDSRIGEIVDENIFKLLTNPLYFNEQLHWQERRKILLEICGDISEQDVINADESLKKLPEILQGRKIEDHRKVLAAKRAEINKELEKIPVRIDEARRGLPNIEGLFNPNVLQTEIDSLKKQQQEKQQEIVRIENGGEVAQKQKVLREIEGRIIDIQNKHRAVANEATYQKRVELNDLKSKAQILSSAIVADKKSMDKLSNAAQALDKKIKILRDAWFKKNEQQFAFSQEEVCPTCGQLIPPEQLQAAREKALTAFNSEKSTYLEGVNQDGKTLKAEFEKITAENNELNGMVLNNETELQKRTQQIEALQAEIANAPAAPDISTIPEYQKVIQEKTAIQQQIDELSGQSQSIIKKLQNEINLLHQDITARERDIALQAQNKAGQKRIEELEAQEKNLAAEYELLESQLYLTEQFIRTKVNLLEERINGEFHYARFKLFNQQINGGLEECCETLGNGVPYSSGLNNAARINVGLDIINTLSAYYQFEAPIFVDNSEAVTKLIDTKSQVIRLVVSEADKVLRIETDKNLREAV